VTGEDHSARREGDGNKEPRTDTPSRDTQAHGVQIFASECCQARTLRESEKSECASRGQSSPQ